MYRQVIVKNQFVQPISVHPVSVNPASVHPASVHPVYSWIDYTYPRVIENQPVVNEIAEPNSNGRKKRSSLTAVQYKTLETEFAKGETIAASRRNELAEQLDLSRNQVMIWFRNRRAKARRHQQREPTSNSSSWVHKRRAALQQSTPPPIQLQPAETSHQNSSSWVHKRRAALQQFTPPPIQLQPEETSHQLEINQPTEDLHNLNLSMFDDQLTDLMDVIEPKNQCGNWDDDFSCCCSDNANLNVQPVQPLTTDHSSENVLPSFSTEFLPSFSTDFVDCEYDFFRDYC